MSVITQDIPWKRYLVLGALFFCSFLLPVWVVSLFLRETPTVAGKTELDPIFPDSLPVKSQGAYFTVKDNLRMTPIDGSDFLFFGWFKFDALPEENKEVVLISKIDSNRAAKPGFSIEIIRKGDSFRPSVYWKNVEGKGGRYEFDDFKLSTSEWYSFVLSYKSPNVLGMHIVSIKEGIHPEWSLLGGYRLKTPVYPHSTVAMQVGATQIGAFRGSIGPVGIISGKNLLDDIKDILKRLAKNPLGIASEFSTKDIIFLTVDGQTDKGPLKIPISQSSRLGAQ